MSFVCEFCKKEYASFNNVIGHQQRNKACLKLQGKCGNICPFCGKDFVGNDNLQKHIQSLCIKAKEEEIKQLKNKIKLLEGGI
jgi:L-lysine 2,3-aminomutase